MGTYGDRYRHRNDVYDDDDVAGYVSYPYRERVGYDDHQRKAICRFVRRHRPRRYRLRRTFTDRVRDDGLRRAKLSDRPNLLKLLADASTLKIRRVLLVGSDVLPRDQKRRTTFLG